MGGGIELEREGKKSTTGEVRHQKEKIRDSLAKVEKERETVVHCPQASKTPEGKLVSVPSSAREPGKASTGLFSGTGN